MWTSLAEVEVTIKAISLYEIQFYFMVLLVSCTAGICRVLRDNEYQSVSNLVGIGLCSGFLGFACVGFMSGANGAVVGYEFRYLAVAALVGLLGREQDQLIKYLVKKLFIAIGATKK